MTVRPTPDQVLALVGDRATVATVVAAADPAAWSAAGCDDHAVWGQYVKTTAEPYQAAVDLTGPAFRCSCPSRKVPCKHCLALLLLHANHSVVTATRLPFAAAWMQRRADRPASTDDAVIASHDGGETDQAAVGALGGGARAPRAEFDPQRDQRRLDRAERMRAGLQELDRWLADRVRAGLAATALADPTTWDRLAARLVDAQCGGLANRVRRVAAKVGQHARWHEDVLEELALLHVLAVGAQRTGHLPANLADGVHAATGLTTSRDDVLASTPSTTRWLVVGESRTREDRITVQRTWLWAGDRSRAARSGEATAAGEATWAMVLAFGVFGNEVTTEHLVGTALEADVHWYPGGVALRAVVGVQHRPAAVDIDGPSPTTIAAALGAVGRAVAAEPWLERFPLCIAVVPVPLGNGRWQLVDDTGALPIVPGFWRLAELVAIAGGAPLRLVGEWSTEGVLPLTVWADGQVIAL